MSKAKYISNKESNHLPSRQPIPKIHKKNSDGTIKKAICNLINNDYALMRCASALMVVIVKNYH